MKRTWKKILKILILTEIHSIEEAHSSALGGHKLQNIL